MSIEEIKFDKFSFVLDSSKLRFDESSIGNYIQVEGAYYDNFGHYLSLAEKHLQNKEILHERIYCERFSEIKESTGSSDKLAECKAKSDPIVTQLKQDIVEAKYIVNRIKNHLKAWDKNHDNAQSTGYMLRKQLDKLSDSISSSNPSNYSNYSNYPAPSDSVDSPPYSNMGESFEDYLKNNS